MKLTLTMLFAIFGINTYAQETQKLELCNCTDKKIDHTELSKQLLGFKIDEAFSLLPPWIYAGKTEIDIHIPYVVNRRIDFSKPAERKYN